MTSIIIIIVINYKFDRCIICLKHQADSKEHIIPQVIGGRFWAYLLCNKCNNNLGTRVISKIKTDPSIRLAVSKLKYEIPHLNKAIENGQLYFARDNNNDLVKLRYKNGKHEVISEKKNGSVIYDTKKASKHIKNILEKEGLLKEEIKDKLNVFHSIDDNKIIKLSNNTFAIKKPIGSIHQDISGNLLDEKSLALIAYEFLSLLIGDLIYADELTFFRDYILKDEKTDKLFIEYYRGKTYQPYHEIYPKFEQPHTVINIVLFGWLVYKIHVADLKIIMPDIVYLEDLKNRKTLISDSVKKAKKGIYYLLN